MGYFVKINPHLGAWREAHFPGSSLVDIALKLGEEAGEVQGAVFKYHWASKEDKEAFLFNLKEEIGDTMMVLASLCQFLDLDLEDILVNRMMDKGVVPDVRTQVESRIPEDLGKPGSNG